MRIAELTSLAAFGTKSVPVEYRLEGFPARRRMWASPFSAVWGVTADNLGGYTNAALRRFLTVFPDVDAIQFRMHDESGSSARRWSVSGMKSSRSPKPSGRTRASTCEPRTCITVNSTPRTSDLGASFYF